jgi:hypothetical protein
MAPCMISNRRRLIFAREVRLSAERQEYSGAGPTQLAIDPDVGWHCSSVSEHDGIVTAKDATVRCGVRTAGFDPSKSD